MKKAAEKLIREGISSGKTMEVIHNELISNGLGTEGFDETYKTVVAELGAEEKHEAVHEGSIYAGVELDPDRPRDMGDVILNNTSERRTRSKKRILSALFDFVLILAIVLAATSTNDSLREFLGSKFRGGDVETEMSPKDAKLVVETNRYQLAADAYKSKIFSYDGLCQSIGLDMNKFECNDTAEAYAIQTQLSDGEYYCVDSTNFAGFVEMTRKEKVSCHQ